MGYSTKYPVKDILAEKEIESGLKAVIRDGLTSQAMGVLTGGVFLVAFALKLGASNFMIGILAAGLVPVLGDKFVDVFAKYELSCHRLGMAREVGEVKKKILIN